MIQQIFDYKASARAMNVPDGVLSSIEKDVRKEYPNDAMLAELHILRALKNYDTQRQAEPVHED